MKLNITLAILLLSSWSSAFADNDLQPAHEPVAVTATTESAPIPVESPQKAMKFVLGGGLTFGGDTLVTASYTDGSSDSITAGGGLMIYAGIDYRVNDAYSLQGTAGYHFDSTKAASNGSAKFSRYPLEMMAYYQVGKAFRVGGGMRYVLGPKLSGSGIASGANQSFGNTVGLVVEGEYLVAPSFGVKLRYVSEKYRPTGSPVTIDGSHAGILANFYL